MLGHDSCIEILEYWRKLQLALCAKRSWAMDPVSRLGFHVAEASELSEAVRGKRDPNKIIEEAGDLMATGLVMIPAEVPLELVYDRNTAKIAKLMGAPIYKGEQRTDGQTSNQPREEPPTIEPRYEIQEIADKAAGNGYHYRITDRRTNSRIATSYVKSNAELIVAALNASK